MPLGGCVCYKSRAEEPGNHAGKYRTSALSCL